MGRVWGFHRKKEADGRSRAGHKGIGIFTPSPSIARRAICAGYNSGVGVSTAAFQTTLGKSGHREWRWPLMLGPRWREQSAVARRAGQESGRRARAVRSAGARDSDRSARISLNSGKTARRELSANPKRIILPLASPSPTPIGCSCKLRGGLPRARVNRGSWEPRLGGRRAWWVTPDFGYSRPIECGDGCCMASRGLIAHI